MCNYLFKSSTRTFSVRRVVNTFDKNTNFNVVTYEQTLYLILSVIGLLCLKSVKFSIL